MTLIPLDWMITPVREAWIRRRLTIGAIVLGATAAACGANEADDVTAQAPELTQLATVIADRDGGGWLVERSPNGSLILSRVEAAADLQMDLPKWGTVTGTESVDGRLLLGGLRCDQDSACGATIAEFAIVENGAIRTVAQFEIHQGPPQGSDSIRIVGEEDGAFWVAGVQSGVLLLDASGATLHEVPVEGDPCVIDGALYQLTDQGNEAGGDTALSASPGSPSNLRFVVSTLEGSSFRSVQGGDLESVAVGQIGRCTGAGFEVSGTGARGHLWSPAAGWIEADFSPPPSDVASSAAVGSSTPDMFVVDSGGRLLVRAAGEWKPTTVAFKMTRGAGAPPIPLYVDSAGKSVVACLGNSSGGGLECAAGQI